MKNRFWRMVSARFDPTVNPFKRIWMSTMMIEYCRYCMIVFLLLMCFKMISFWLSLWKRLSNGSWEIVEELWMWALINFVNHQKHFLFGQSHVPRMTQNALLLQKLHVLLLDKTKICLFHLFRVEVLLFC